MDLWNKISGTVLLEMTCADPERMISQLTTQGIVIWDLKRYSQLLMEFRIQRTDWEQVSLLAQKYGASFRILGMQGFVYDLKNWSRRPIILVCLLLLSALTMILPERILFVDVKGNRTIPGRMILEEAQKQGLQFGADRRNLRSEKIKNELLGAMDALEWVGVNTQGCRAVITVREREEQTRRVKEGYSSLVACTDGIIEDIIMNRGTLVCRTGQAVQEGDILVSGYTELGICTRVTDAQAEIYALTNRSLCACAPCSVQMRDRQTREEIRFSLIFGKKRINLYPDSGILPSTCGKMTYTYPLQLPGGDVLPVVLVIQRIVWYDISNTTRTQLESEELLLEFTQNDLMEQIVSGEILSRQTEMEYSADCAVLSGRFQCREMIARRYAGVFLEGDTQDDSQNSQRGAG